MYLLLRDISILTRESKDNIRKYIDERLPSEYEKCLVGLTSILKEAWITAAKTEDKREKLQALSLAKECYSMKLAAENILPDSDRISSLINSGFSLWII